jgi:hypothetical protein
METNLGLIFDVDGVLVDSYWAHFKSWQIAAGEFGFTVTEDQFRQNFGRKSHETIVERWGSQLTAEQVAQFEQRKEAAYRDVIRDDFPAMDGARELIDAWHAAWYLARGRTVEARGPPLRRRRRRAGGHCCRQGSRHGGDRARQHGAHLGESPGGGLSCGVLTRLDAAANCRVVEPVTSIAKGVGQAF